jgi:hypothetical protein
VKSLEKFIEYVLPASPQRPARALASTLAHRMITLKATVTVALIIAVFVMVLWVLKKAGLFAPITARTTILGPYMVLYDHYTVGNSIKGFQQNCNKPS